MKVKRNIGEDEREVQRKRGGKEKELKKKEKKRKESGEKERAGK